MTDEEIIEQAQKRFARCVEAEQENRKEFIDDLNFYAGEQWPAQLKSGRESQKRPVLTINRMPQFVRQVTNDQRQNRPAIKIRPADDDADVETAEVMSGLVRHIESNSNADQAYDNAFFYAVTGGFGYFRILTDYANDSSFEQEIFIKRIANPLTCYRDPDSVEPDGSDFSFFFICDDVPKEDYEAEYGKEDYTAWNMGGMGDVQGGWVNKDSVRVCEYYYIEPKKLTLYLLPDGSVTDKEPKGIKAVDTRTVNSKVVKWAKICGDKIKDKRDLPGSFIPVVPVYGDEITIEGKRKLLSLIRFAKDPQRMFNYWRSTETELLALQSKAPFVAAEGQMEGYEQEWAKANTDNVAYLTYKPVTLGGSMVPPPQRQGFASPPTGVLQGALNAEGDMKSVTGIFDASLGAKSNETSGRAIMARQREGDVSTFHFIDNMTRAIRQAGRVLVEYIPVVYDTPRVVRILGLDGQEEMKQINQPFETTEKGQAVERIFDMNMGSYDVVCTAGPSYSTQRQEAAESMNQILQGNPQLMQVAGDLFIKSMDWPGAEEIAERLKRSIPPELTADEDEEGPQIPPMLQQQMAQMDDAINQREQVIQQMQQSIKGMEAEKAQLVMDAKSKQADYQLKSNDQEIKIEVERMNAQIKDREVAIKEKELILKEQELELRKYEIDIAQIANAQASMNQSNAEPQEQQSTQMVEMLAAMTAQIVQGNQAIAEHLSRPKQAVIARDASGRAIGIESIQ